MPPDLELRVARNGRFFWVFRYILLGAYVLLVLSGSTIPPTRVGLSSRNLLLSTLGGAAIGLLMFLVAKYGRLSLSNTASARPEAKDAVAVWVTIIVVGAFCEELWRAYCIVALQADGLNVQNAILLTSAIFAVSQLGGRPSRITADKAQIIYTGVVGGVLGSLFLVSRSLAAPAFANLLYHLLSLFEFT
jgi:hypothetical protein